MSAKSKTALNTQANSLLPDNVNREIGASDVRVPIKDLNDSTLNLVDGGMVIQALTGYSTVLTPTDNRHLTPKKYVDDLIASIDISTCLFIDGSNAMLADLNVGGFSLRNVDGINDLSDVPAIYASIRGLRPSDSATVMLDWSTQANGLEIATSDSGFSAHIYTNNLSADANWNFPNYSGSHEFTSVTAAQTLTNKTLTSPIINLGSDADYDMYYRLSGALTRIAKGASPDGYVLTLVSGVPAWAVSAGGVPTQITVANEGTDTTCFPAFFTAATGDLGPKTNAGYTYNSNTNTLTVTTFVGALTGNASTATALQNARTIGGVSFDGTANITVSTATSGFTISGGDLALGANNITITGSIGTTGARVTKGWFTDLQVTNAIAGSITGNAATVTTNANLTGPITSSGNATSVASQTGTGSTFVMDTSPTIVMPVVTTSITTGSTTFSLVNATATTVNFAGAATTLNIGNASGTNTISGSNTLSGITTVSNATASTTASNGALIVTGGVGIGGALNLGGSISMTGTALGVALSAATTVLTICTGFTTFSIDTTAISLKAGGTTSFTYGAGAVLTGPNGTGGWTVQKNANLNQTATGFIFAISGTTTSSSTAVIDYCKNIGTINNTTGTITVNLFNANPTVTNLNTGGVIYGYRGQLANAPTGGGAAYNCYMDGTAPNLFAGITSFTNTTDSSSISTGGVVLSGGLAFAKKMFVGTGILPDSGGLKHARVTTGSVSGGSTALVTITWTTAFADANYTVTADVIDSTTTSLSLSVVHIESVTASAVTVRVLNNAIGSLTGTVHVIAIHD